MTQDRLTTGNADLDQMLGGGLLPGTLTVVAGATGIGKTQLGINYLFAGAQQEGRPGGLLDLSARGDSQNHAGYAERLLDQRWQSVVPDEIPEDPTCDWVFDSDYELANALSMLGYQGRRVVRDQLDAEQWDAWQKQVNRNLVKMIGFLYGQMVRGARRFLIDGIEPLGRPEDSLQMDLFEYAYHKIIRQQYDWVARDLLRQNFRRLADRVEEHRYDDRCTACVLLCTTPESMLEQLIDKPLADGDLSATANTLIYMGKIRDGDKVGRGLYVAKHRGSPCDESIRRFQIDDSGINLASS